MMTFDKAIKNLQDIYDLIIDFNTNIQDVDMTKVLELEKEFVNLFHENQVEKHRNELHLLFKTLLNFKKFISKK